MHADVHGPADGPPVVLLHGGTGTGDYHWRMVVRELSDRWRLVVPDLPGHGHSPLPADGRYDLEVLVAAVAEQLDALGPPVAVVGFSLGGHAALHLAARSPERFAALGLIGVSLFEHDGLGPWRALFDPERMEAEHPLWARTLARHHAPQGGPEAWKDVVRRDASGLHQPVPLERLDALACPRLLVRGDRDPALDPDHYAQLKAVWGEDVEEGVVPGGGHEVHMSRPRVTGPMLRDFLARHIA